MLIILIVYSEGFYRLHNYYAFLLLKSIVSNFKTASICTQNQLTIRRKQACSAARRNQSEYHCNKSTKLFAAHKFSKRASHIENEDHRFKTNIKYSKRTLELSVLPCSFTSISTPGVVYLFGGSIFL